MTFYDLQDGDKNGGFISNVFMWSSNVIYGHTDKPTSAVGDYTTRCVLPKKNENGTSSVFPITVELETGASAHSCA